jgi:hypothetical protein
MGTLVHTCLGSSYLLVHVLHCPPLPPAHRFIVGPAVINTHTHASVGSVEIGGVLLSIIFFCFVKFVKFVVN